MKKITFVIPSRNNLEFLKLAYNSIRNLGEEIFDGMAQSKINHEILVLNDASTDGTKEWIDSLEDKDLITHHNPGPERIGIVGMFDKGIEMAKTDIIFAFHADMIAAPNLDVHILKHLKKRTVVSATRVEPPLHPPGPEKIIQDFGIEVEDFKEKEWLEWNKSYIPSLETTEGIFAPWCMYKEDFLDVGGHDELFAPQSKEDSDLFNRFVLNGYNVIQTWEGRVYHFTSRGSRFNKHAGGAAGKNSEEWLHTTTKNMKNFIRKWGTVVKHDSLMKPIISPKYNIGFIIKNCTPPLLEALEPWCDIVYTDLEEFVLYEMKEQPNTSFNLSDKLKSYDSEKNNEILINIDGNTFNNEDFRFIQNFAEILSNDKDLDKGEFILGNLKIDIIQMNTYEKDLIKLR